MTASPPPREKIRRGSKAANKAYRSHRAYRYYKKENNSHDARKLPLQGEGGGRGPRYKRL